MRGAVCMGGSHHGLVLTPPGARRCGRATAWQSHLRHGAAQRSWASGRVYDVWRGKCNTFLMMILFVYVTVLSVLFTDEKSAVESTGLAGP